MSKISIPIGIIASQLKYKLTALAKREIEERTNTFALLSLRQETHGRETTHNKKTRLPTHVVQAQL